MKPSALKTNTEVLEDLLRVDPAARAEWQRTGLSRAVAIACVRYRGEHGLVQRDLAEQLGMSERQVELLEVGEVTPSVDAIIRLTSLLGGS
jgi:ribosome-binding protein aMBF1 (putative translation factor)